MRSIIIWAVLLILGGCASPQKPAATALPKTVALQMHAAEEISGRCYIQDNDVRFEFSKPVDVVLKCHADCQVVTASGPQSAGIGDFQLQPGWSHGSAEATNPPAHPVGLQGGTATCLSE
jgi:hypothetical protein